MIKKDNNPNYLTWKNDGADGPNDPKCSEFYLVDWLASKERYMRWCNPPGALTKLKVCEEITEMIKRIRDARSHLMLSACTTKSHTSNQKWDSVMTNMPGQRKAMVSRNLTHWLMKIRWVSAYIIQLLNNLVTLLSFIFNFRLKGFAHTTLT